jgi:hypothetical protein
LLRSAQFLDRVDARLNFLRLLLKLGLLFLDRFHARGLLLLTLEFRRHFRVCRIRARPIEDNRQRHQRDDDEQHETPLHARVGDARFDGGHAGLVCDGV